MAPEVTARTGRALDALRKLEMTRNASPYAEGSCLITCGNTRVLCTASVEDGVPGWKRGKGEGSFVRETRGQTFSFYRDLVQDLKSWQARAPMAAGFTSAIAKPQAFRACLRD